MKYVFFKLLRPLSKDIHNSSVSLTPNIPLSVALITDLLIHYFKSRTIHHVHSPYLYDFAKNVLEKMELNEDIVVINQYQKNLSKSTESLDWQDIGSQSRRSNHLTVGKMSKLVSTSQRKGKLIYHLAKWSQANTILELGTAFGIGTAYLSKAAPQAKIYTIEGQASLKNQIKKTAENLSLSNVVPITGLFERKLPEILEKLQKVDLVFIDGDHRAKACRSNFELISPYLSDKAIVVFDDIYWSTDMKAFWKDLGEKSNNTKAVNSSRAFIDLFDYGIVFSNPDFQDKINYRLIPKKWKPLSFST